MSGLTPFVPPPMPPPPSCKINFFKDEKKLTRSEGQITGEFFSANIYDAAENILKCNFSVFLYFSWNRYHLPKPAGVGAHRRWVKMPANAFVGV